MSWFWMLACVDLYKCGLPSQVDQLQHHRLNFYTQRDGDAALHDVSLNRSPSIEARPRQTFYERENIVLRPHHTRDTANAFTQLNFSAGALLQSMNASLTVYHRETGSLFFGAFSGCSPRSKPLASFSFLWTKVQPYQQQG